MFEPILPADKVEALPKYDHKVIRPNGRVSPRQTDVAKTWARAREQLMRVQSNHAPGPRAGE